MNETGFGALDAGALPGFSSQQPGKQAYCTALTVTERRYTLSATVKHRAAIDCDWLIKSPMEEASP